MAASATFALNAGLCVRRARLAIVTPDLRHSRRLQAETPLIDLSEFGQPALGTQPEHMPSAHRRYAEWTPERLQRQARGIGPNTEALIIAVLARRPHPEQGFRTCLGVLRLFRGVDAARAEGVSQRAVEIGA